MLENFMLVLKIEQLQGVFIFILQLGLGTWKSCIAFSVTYA